MKGFVWFKKGIALILTVALILCSTTGTVLGETPEALATVCEKHYNSSNTATTELTEDELSLAIKQYLWQELYNCEESIDLSAFKLSATQKNVNFIYKIIFEQLPAAFHISSFTPYRTSKYLTAIVPEYTYDAETYHNMYEECMVAAEKLLDGIKGNSSLGEVEKALLLHDRIAVHCEYDYARLKDGNVPAVSYNMYGALVNQIAVCEGYTDTYIYLLDQVGMKSDYCSSDELYHAWNIVYVDGEAYHVDITWDDPVWDITGRVMHNNFLLSTKALYYGVNGSAPHDATDYSSTPADNKFDNYFWQDSETAFQLIDNEIYYFDTEDEEIKKYSDKSTLKEIEDDFYLYWGHDFTRLASDGEKLYYSQHDAVYSFDVNTKATEKVFTPDLEDFLDAIYGFTYCDGYLICDIESTPNFDRYSKNNQIKYLLCAQADVDCNGKTSLSDVVVLSRYIAGWEKPGCSESTLDVNGDNKVTLYDVVILARYLAGWDIVIK